MHVNVSFTHLSLSRPSTTTQRGSLTKLAPSSLPCCCLETRFNKTLESLDVQVQSCINPVTVILAASIIHFIASFGERTAKNIGFPRLYDARVCVVNTD